MIQQPAPPRAWRFWAYVASQVVSSTGDQVHLLAIGLLALQLTDSAFSFALLTTFSTIPNLGVALVAGTVADRMNRRVLMILADGARALIVASIVALALTGHLTLWYLYVTAFCLVFLGHFFDTAALAMLPEMVSAEHLGQANAQLYTAQSGSGLIGPGLAGVIIGAVGLLWAVTLNAASFLFSSAALLLIGRGSSLGTIDRAGLTARPSFLRDLRDGITFSLERPILRTTALVVMVGNIGAAAMFSIVLYYAVRVLGVTATEVGFVLAFAGAGGLLGSLIANRVATRFGRGNAIVIGEAMVALAGLLLLFGGNVYAYALAMFVEYMAIPTVTVNTRALRQSSAPKEMYGRVFAFSRTVGLGTVPIGALLGGLIAERYGVRPVFALGVLLAAAAAFGGWRAGLRSA